MKLKMITGVMILLILISMLTIAFNVPPILADAGTAELPDDNSTIQKTDGDKQSNLPDSHESFVSESPDWKASAKENRNLYSFGATEWNFNKINEWADFAKVDDDSAELVIGVNNEKPNSHEYIEGLIDENGGDLVGTVSMGDKIKAIIADIPLPTIPHFATEVETAGLSRYIEPNMKFQTCFIPNDPYWSYQWGPRIVEANHAWNTTIGDPSVLVAVIDTGTDYDHPDLAANYVPLGYDWVNDDADPMDDHGHGTHCAGIIAAVINNSIGVAGLAQINIMAEKGIDAGGWGTEDDLANAIIHAVDQGADILSNSWGSYGESALIYEAVEYAYDQGVLVIAAAGNDATSIEHFPAAFDEVIAVTATDEYDNPAWVSGWWGTNFGDWVELAAPGVDIYSTVWDDSYAYMSGTSMAAPHVAGVAALILSQFPSMTRDQVRLQLRFTADDLGDLGFDDYYGYGRINARRAVEQAPPDHDLLILDWETPLFVEPGGLTIVNTTVFNFGKSNETNIQVQLFANGSIVDSATIGFLETTKSETVNCSWTPMVEGTYNLTSYVVPVQNETLTANNLVTAMVDVGYFKYILFDQTHWTDSIVMYDVWVNTLSERGYVVDVHTSGPITSTVLADYVAFVIPQAQDLYSLEELSAIQSFVVAGGGLLVIGDDVPSVYTDLTAFAGISWVSGGYPGITADVTPHEVTFGVTSVYLDAPIAEMFVGGCAQDLVRDPMGGIMLAVSEQLGRVIGFADEGSLWDYGITREDNLLLANNMIDWLVFQPEHDLAVILETPPYVAPGDSSLLSVTVRNRGLSNETDVELFLFINGTIVKNETAPEIVSDSSYTMDYLWTPAGENVMYNVTGYAVPVENETITANNLEWAYVYIGVPVKAFVLDSAGTDNSGIISTWQLLTTNWYMFGEKMTFIDYTTLNKEDLTYEDLAATDADVLIISCASDPYQGWEFTDSEIEAIGRYVQEGHGLIATSGTFYGMVPNNNKLAPLFGLTETTTWYQSYTDLLHIEDPTHPLFDNVPNPYTFPEAYTSFPSDGQWSSNELAGGEYVALGHFQESAIVVYRGLVYISPLLEYAIPPYYHHHLQLLYNAITWSSYQKPEHELVVSLEAPNRLEPGESTLLNATVSNFGLNNETNVELFLLIDGATVENARIPELLTGSSFTLSYLWSPTVEAVYNVTAYAPPVPEEEFLANNFDTKMVLVKMIVAHVVFEEAHLPAYTIGSNPADDVTGGYSEFADYLTAFGCTVSTIDPGTLINSIVLGPVDVLVIVAPQNSYLASEIDTIETWVKGGGKLLLISDWGPFSVQARTIAARFGIDLAGDVIHDVDENVGYTAAPYYEGANLLPHGITAGVARVEMYAGDGVLSAPADEIPLIVTDSDGTATWDDGSPALAVSVMSALDGGSAGSGRLVIITDSNVWDSVMDIDGDGDVGFYDSDNEVLALNSVDWLAVIYEHDVTVSLDAPAFIEPGDSSLLNATAHNRGLSNETDVELFLLINGTAVNSTTIPEMLTGQSYTINYLWTPAVEATYNVTAYAPPVPGENITADNGYMKFIRVAYAVIIGIIETHGESLHTEELAHYYRGLDHIVEKITTTITPGILDNYDIIIVGEDWSDNPWLSSEIVAVEASIDSGKGFIAIGDELATSVQEILGTYGIKYAGISAPSGSSSHFDPLHPIMQGVSLIYASYPVNSLQITAPAYWIANDVSDTHILIAGAEVGGTVLCLSNDFAFDLYIDDNEVMFKNIVDWMVLKYEHELALSLDAPAFIEPGDSSLLNATAHNRGLSNETDVELFLLINGTAVNSTTIPQLLTGETYKINYLWAPTVEAAYNVTAYAPPVPGENVTENNVMSKMVYVRYITAALISDQSQLPAITPILDSMGIGYDVYNDNSMYLYTEDLDLLLSYETVIFYTEYRHLTMNEYSTLESYLSSGGNLLVTGFDSLVSDDLLRDLIRSATMGDNMGEPDLYVANATHPIMNGPYGSFPVGYHISGLFSDCDAVEADTGRNAITVAWLADGYDKIIATDGLPGKVVYWNGRGDYDWVNNVDCETMLGNILAWLALPIIPRDVAIISVTSSATEVYEGQIVNITIVAKNEGNITETFDVAAYYGASVIGTQNVANLTAGANVTLTFNWDTSSAKPSLISYMIKAIAASVPGEIDTADNTYFDGYVKVKMLGDVNGDGIIDIVDVAIAAIIFGSAAEDDPETPWDETLNWNPIVDLNEDGIIDIVDLVIIGVNFGKRLPEGFERTTVYVDPQATTVMVGETFTVSVKIFNVTNLFGFEYKLFWNSTYLNLTSYTIHVPAGWEPPNGFLVKDEIGVWMGGNKTGLAYHWYAYTSITGAPFTGDLTLATYTFEALNPGICALDIQKDRFVDNTANYIPHDTVDGYVTIV